MGTATYRIGPSDFFTPGDLTADANTVQAQVDVVNQQVTGNESAPSDFVDQWNAFETHWKGFYADHFGGFFSSWFSAFNDSNRDELISYENQLAAFQKQAQGFGADIIAPVAPSTGAGDTLGAQLGKQLAGAGLPSISTLVVLAVVGIVAFVIWKKA
jgi:hypothetical protein